MGRKAKAALTLGRRTGQRGGSSVLVHEKLGSVKSLNKVHAAFPGTGTVTLDRCGGCRKDFQSLYPR